MMKFEKGTIVSHTASFNKFYIIIEFYNNGQYLVEDYDYDFLGKKDQYVFMENYLLTKTDRRDYILEDILKTPSK